MNELRLFIASQEKNISEFAHDIGYTIQYVSNIVNGRNPITAAFVTRCWRKYGECAAVLLPLIGEQPNDHNDNSETAVATSGTDSD